MIKDKTTLNLELYKIEKYFTFSVFVIFLCSCGEHCWVLDVTMDCAESDDGWFEVMTEWL